MTVSLDPEELLRGIPRSNHTRAAALAGSVFLFATDFVALYACQLAAYQFRGSVLSRFSLFHLPGEPIGHKAYLFFVSIYLLVFGLSGLYHRRTSALEESAVLLRACFYSTACALTISSLAHISEWFSRTVIVLSALLIAGVVPASRYASKSLLGKWKLWRKPIVLLGANANGLRAAQDMSSDITMGYSVLGIMATGPVRGVVPWQVWLAPDRDRAIEFCRAAKLRSFILCEENGDEAGLLRAFHLLEEFADEIKIAAALEGLHSLRIESEALRSSYLLGYENPLTKPLNRLLKRLLDLALGSVLIVLFLPAFLILPLLIRASSRGPILFHAERLGLGGRRFSCLKFRTMYDGAEVRLNQLLSENESARREYAESYKLRRDPRVTRIGAWLRRSSLDELPQLWNVLRGEMSLVGPRPIRADETRMYDVELTNYFRVPCGLTGMWQISGRNDLSYPERVRLDVFYARNWSIWLDLAIIARTMFHMVRPHGAY